MTDYELFTHQELREKWFVQEDEGETPEEKRLLGKVGKVCQEIIIETAQRSSHYQDLEYHAKFAYQLPSKGGDYFRSNLVQVLDRELVFSSHRMNCAVLPVHCPWI